MFKTLFYGLVAPLFLFIAYPCSCFADDVADVKKSVIDLYVKLDTGDATGFSAYVPAAGFTEFNTDSPALHHLDLAYFKGAMTSGAKIDLHVSDLNVRIFGDAAVATGYRVGSITLPQGQKIDSDQCLTMVWIKESGRWKLQHVHLSPRTAEKSS